MNDNEGNLYCNCSQCKVELLSKGEDGRAVPLAGRIKGRPFCSPCLAISSSGVSGVSGGRGAGGDPSPWQENAVRSMEGN